MIEPTLVVWLSIEGCGLDVAVCSRLELDRPRGFVHIHGCVDYGNQPCCELAHLFNYAGNPKRERGRK